MKQFFNQSTSHPLGDECSPDTDLLNILLSESPLFSQLFVEHPSKGSETLQSRRSATSVDYSALQSQPKTRSLLGGANLPRVFLTKSNNLSAKSKSSDGPPATPHTSRQRVSPYFTRENVANLIKSQSNWKRALQLSEIGERVRVVNPELLPCQNQQKKTLVLDLDETLVHCNPRGQVELELNTSVGTVVVKVNIRPFVREFLRKVSREFEVVVFTASSQVYADAVVDYLDPQKRFIVHRFYRQHCTVIEGACVKDLRVLANRDLKHIVLVDNFVYSFSFQLHNGIPALPWFDDWTDRHLLELAEYLAVLADSPDVRKVNCSMLGLCAPSCRS